jgi:peptidyl-Asp metalloendopeptidase
MKFLRYCGVILLFVLPSMPVAAASRATTPTSVFTRIGPLPIKAVADPKIIRGRAVRVNFQALEASVRARAARPKSAPSIGLNLFADRSFSAVLDRVTSELAGTTSWIGHLEGFEDSRVTLVWGGGVLVGSVVGPDGFYRIHYTPSGVHVIEEMDSTVLPEEAAPTQIEYLPAPGVRSEVPELESSRQQSIEATAENALQTVTAALADDGTTFDILVVYTPAARNAEGGTAGIQNLIALGITETNTSFANSAVIPRLRLVATAEVAYTETGSLETDRDRLQRPADGFMDNVHALRNANRADMVQLLVEGGDACGISFLMPGSNNRDFEAWGFAVTQRLCVSPNYSFGHELGHIMGCNHAPGDPTGTGAFTSSFGYKDPGHLFRTIMAYECSAPFCPRILHWSNPNVTSNGQVTGSSTQNNAESINAVRHVVSNFRQADSSYTYGNCATYIVNRESNGTFFTCPSAQVMVGRAHAGDENGTTSYNCCNAFHNGVQAVPFGQVWSNNIKESSSIPYTCPGGTVLVGRYHSGDENGTTRYSCAFLDFGGVTRYPDANTCAWSSGLRESSSNYVCAFDRVMVGRQHSGDENGTTWNYCCNMQ